MKLCIITVRVSGGDRMLKNAQMKGVQKSFPGRIQCTLAFLDKTRPWFYLSLFLLMDKQNDHHTILHCH